MQTRAKQLILKPMWLAVGLICVALAAIGVVLPLMPTTIFLIIAAYAFARSSERLHTWLLSNPVFGPVIQDWQMHKAISTSAKGLALVSMALVIAVSIWINVPVWVIAVQGIILGSVAVFLVTRPTPPKS